MTNLEEYYNKFNEDKRLLTRHGQVEINTTMYYLHQMLERLSTCDKKKIIDIGAGTGRYSIALAKEGNAVTAVELVNHNLGLIKKHAREELKETDCFEAYKGDARKLKRFTDNSFDCALLLGPMYHLHSLEDKKQALSEAVRLVKPGGFIMVGYVMADYAIVRYGFMDHNIEESRKRNVLTDDYNIKSDEEELYDYVRISDIDDINRGIGVQRYKIISPDGPTDYIRNYLNSMSDNEFALLMDYQIKNADRSELVGAGSHTVDILIKT